jgi:hypothetical protein
MSAFTAVKTGEGQGEEEEGLHVEIIRETSVLHGADTRRLFRAYFLTHQFQLVI